MAAVDHSTTSKKGEEIRLKVIRCKEDNRRAAAKLLAQKIVQNLCERNGSVKGL